MKLGFFTACLPSIPLDELAKWAAKNGFGALELASWPVENARDYSGSTLLVDGMTKDAADEVKGHFEEAGIAISSLGYYDNNLAADKKQRTAVQTHLKKVIDAAEKLEVPLVGTFVGRDITKSVRENMGEFGKVFIDLIGYAEDHGVKLMIENCPMVGWQKAGEIGNCACTPELWERMFDLVPSENFGLNYDPSHSYWMGIDILGPVFDFAERIFHTHAKDTEILEDALEYFGYYGSLLEESSHDNRWWRYRVPGLGEIDWTEFVSVLGEAGFDGALSIEHEDPVWEGNVEKVQRGLILGRNHLLPLIV